MLLSPIQRQAVLMGFLRSAHYDSDDVLALGMVAREIDRANPNCDAICNNLVNFVGRAGDDLLVIFSLKVLIELRVHFHIGQPALKQVVGRIQPSVQAITDDNHERLLADYFPIFRGNGGTRISRDSLPDAVSKWLARKHM